MVHFIQILLYIRFLFLKAFKKNTYVLIALFTISITVCAASYKKEKEVFEQVMGKQEISDIEKQVSKRIPSDFDWNNIPSGLSDLIWEIKDDFDFGGQTITLPNNVTLCFKGGVLSNGTITGNETIIESNSTYQVFNSVNLTGTFKSEYLKPQWFGAVMDGVTDDRAAFVKTLANADTLGRKVLIDQDIFLDVEETATKSVFLEDNTWIEGVNDANIIVNNLLSPAFYMALTKNITLKNITFLYDNAYDATYGWDITMHDANLVALRSYLATKHNILFTSSYPVSRSPIAWRAIFSLEAPENVEFDNVIFKAKGETADTFIQWAIKFKEQYTANQSVVSSKGVTDIPRNIDLNNVTMDGVLMGIQGIVGGFKSDGLISYRYSDVQDFGGTNIGGSGTGGNHWMPPPHLIYLNPDSSTDHNAHDIEILNTIDYGIYVGSANTRGGSGYCHSLKLVEDIENVIVDNYKSCRRDGLWDIGRVTNGVFKNIYAKSTSDIFDSSWKFNSARFLGPLNNCTFENITIKDNADIAEIYPLDVVEGDYVFMNNVNVYVNELNTSSLGLFGISGSNNTILNSSLNIKNHTTTKEYRGVVYHYDDAKNTDASNNHYEVLVNGWRDIAPNPIPLSIRMLFQEPSNPNDNYAKVIDVSNNFVIEQINERKKDMWTRTEVVQLGNGLSHLLDINIPKEFAVNKISATALEGLARGINVSIGTSTTLRDDLLATVASTAGKVSTSTNASNASKSSRSIYLHSNGDFQNTGKIEVTIELIRVK